jgi:hypothetical protein
MKTETVWKEQKDNNANLVLVATCHRIDDGKIISKGYLYRGYEIRNHGYYPPDQCIWWEAIDIKTGCADFHEHTKRNIIKSYDK